LPRVCEKRLVLVQSIQGNSRTFQRGVEHEAANANKKVPKIGDGEDGVVAMLSAAFDALVGKIQEQ
jgi:hypothetical protein